MVTQSATILERHLLLAGEPPPLHSTDFQKLASVLSKRKSLAKEDPMSHRIIEKRRRDRMNNCLADLSRLIPTDYMKKGRGRIEKTEIIEMAIKHMKHLQDHHSSCHLGSYEPDHHQSIESEESYSPPESNTSKISSAVLPTHENMSLLEVNGGAPQIVEEHYGLGYHECLSEAMHFLVECEGHVSTSPMCVKLISHLQRHYDKFLKGGRLNAPRVHTGTGTTTSSSSMGSKERSSGSGSGSSSDGGERMPLNLVDDNYYTSASQLRDILTSNNHSQNRLKMVPEPPSPPMSVNGASSHTESHMSGSLYKFKNNIKQRFSAEHSGNMEQSHPLALKRRRSEDRETLSMPSPPPVKYHQPPSPSSPSPPSAFSGVPIFALHSKCGFYIPLTVDHHVLAPFLPDLRPLDSDLSSVVLHPVTISVNFHQTITRPLKQPPCFPQSPVSWSPSQNTYLPLPKWATCAPERN
uniref:BHLH domain-containing protein n=1 Tax=Graphocephala atropunctata TaxID=36148 RepID=A0A1B6LV34_9HEMI